MTTLLETERLLLTTWEEYSAASPETDDEIDYWADRLGPFQCAIEQATPATAEDAAVILREVARNTDGYGAQHVSEQIHRVAEWLDPGHGLACTDPRILRPCPFCGESEHLTIDEGEFERVPVIDGKVVEPVWAGIHPTNMEYVDAIHCQVCECIAPLDAWNHTRPASDYAALRDFDEPEVADAAKPERIAA